MSRKLTVAIAVTVTAFAVGIWAVFEEIDRAVRKIAA